jgi:hypothetical protein
MTARKSGAMLAIVVLGAGCGGSGDVERQGPVVQATGGFETGGTVANTGGTEPVETGGTGGAPNTGAQSSTGGQVQLDLDGGIDPGAGVYSDVNVIITADNAYGFGYGTSTAMANYFGGIESGGGAIFDCPIGYGPEAYTVPAADAAAGGFVYIVTWSDTSVTQGVIAQFFRDGGDPVYTGQGEWTVCATGQQYEFGSGGPDLETINTQIANCNAGTTPSSGWIDSNGTASGKLQFGENNTTDRKAQVVAGNEFPLVCGIDGQARWMWFNWDPANIIWPTQGSPFIYPNVAGNPTQQFLVFRLGAENIPPVIY